MPNLMSDNDFAFDYELPRELIAQEPLANRVDARLMVVDRRAQRIDHYHVRDLPSLLEAGDRLVLNDTKVIPAALMGQRTVTGGRWRGLYLTSLPDGHLQIICKTRGKLAAGEAITLFDRDMRPTCKLWLLDRQPDGSWTAHAETDLSIDELLAKVGRSGNRVDADVETYQTVFAREPGAVAAPTAGLHFTRHLLEALEQYGIGTTAITLHVGLGTFRPIQSETLDAHEMHSEKCEVSSAAADEINATRAAGGRIVAVGTTVVRTLETVAHLTNRREADPLRAWSGQTELFIRPPFEFRAVDGLLTNFHFPRTTLLVLVQTFGGRELMQQAYQEAIQEQYRFYSYGDAMLIV